MPALTESSQQVVELQEPAGGPSKLRCRLYSRSFDAYFKAGIDFTVSSIQSPFLTWQEGSASQGVETPALTWVLVSFRDAQPPLVLGFSGAKASAIISGRPGAWHLRVPQFKGWLRIALPTGTDGVAANTARSLGRLYREVSKEAKEWAAPSPEIVGKRIVTDPEGVEYHLAYDRPGTVLQSPIIFAPMGGYPIRLNSEARRADHFVEDRPVDILESSEMTLRLPVRRLPLGRALTDGRDSRTPVDSISFIDVPSLVDAAVDSLFASTDGNTLHLGRAATEQFISETPYYFEPVTRQQFPYSEAGTGLDTTAAHALLLQVTRHAEGDTQSNPLLDSVLLRMDAQSWLVSAADPTLSRRASSLAALAGALSEDPASCLAAGMLQAGLAAQKGWRKWAAARELATPKEGLTEPLKWLRDALFAGGPNGQVLAALRSPVRLLSDGAFEAAKMAAGYQLSWRATSITPQSFDISWPAGAGLAKVDNLTRIQSVTRPNLLSIEYTAESIGICRAKLVLPPGIRIPRWSPPPAYSE